MWLVNLPNQLCIIALVGRYPYQQALKHRLPIRKQFNLYSGICEGLNLRIPDSPA